MNFIEKHRNQVILVILVLTLFNTCNSLKNNSIMNSMQKKTNPVVDCISKVEIDSLLKSQLKNFLRYEEDIDNKVKKIEDVMAEIDKN